VRALLRICVKTRILDRFLRSRLVRHERQGETPAPRRRALSYGRASLGAAKGGKQVANCGKSDAGTLKRFLQNMKRIAEKWRQVMANPGLYIASAVFVVLLCAFANRDLAAYFHDWHRSIWQQGSVCVLIALLYLFFPRRAAIFTQVVFGIALIVIFGVNTFHERSAPYWFIAGTAASLMLYCMAEAFEIAYTLLRTKELDRFDAHDRVTTLLSKINDEYKVFYEAREWLVIALVIGLTLASDFEHLALPYPPYEFTDRWIRLAFSLLFTTVVVVWVAQSPGKALAAENPVLCMRYCGWLWRPLRFFGRLMEGAQMFEPAVLLKDGLLKAMPQFREKPNLHPSQDAFFNAAVKRYGYCLHALRDDIVIHDGGNARIREVGLFYIVCGRRTRFVRPFELDEPITAKADGTPSMTFRAEAFILPGFTEEIDAEVRGALDAILSGNSHPLVTRIDPGLSLRAEFWKDDHKQAALIIESPQALPEDVAPNKDAIAIYYEVTVHTNKGVFKLPGAQGPTHRVHDFYFREFTFPCYCARICILLNENTNPAKFAAIEPHALLSGSMHRLETGQIKAQPIGLKGIQFEIKYPMPGVRYQVSWEVWRDSA
jgi:uncharacterized membrane protein HdeD (DUF308 family)